MASMNEVRNAPPRRRSVVGLLARAFALPWLSRRPVLASFLSGASAQQISGTTPVWLDVIGAKGDGVEDDTEFLIGALKSSRQVKAGKNKIYRIRPIVIHDVFDLTLDLNGSTLLIDRATPTGPSPSGLSFKSSSALGDCAKIRILNGKIAYKNKPAMRVDNNFAIYAEGVRGLEISKLEIDGSWSAGVWIQKSEGISIKDSYVHGTMADGITCQGCGKNVSISSNRIASSGDDAIAVTWFTGNDPSYVGNPMGMKLTSNVKILGNECTDSAARGIFLGGVKNGEVAYNRIFNSNAIGVLLARDTVNQDSEFFYKHGVNNSNASIDVHDNTLVRCAIASNSLYAEVGGIWVSERNVDINISDNVIFKCNSVHIYFAGNGRISRNKSYFPQWIGGGRVKRERMIGRGTHIMTGVSSFSRKLNYGDVTENIIVGDSYYAIWIGSGSDSHQWRVAGNKIFVSPEHDERQVWARLAGGRPRLDRLIRVDPRASVQINENSILDIENAPSAPTR